MHAFARNSLFVAWASMGVAAPAFAGTTGVFLPTAPTGSGGEDSIETSTGTRCRQSMNSNGAYVDMGLTGTTASPQDDKLYGYSDSRDREATAYLRVTIPLGHRPDRIDCSRIYELELARLQREVELLRIGVK